MAESQSKQISEWRERIAAAEAIRKKDAKQDQWGKWRRAYRNDWESDDEGNPPLSLNMVYAVGRNILPQIYLNDPHVYCTGGARGDAAGARVLETVLNETSREMNVARQMKLACVDTYICGTGWLKIGYDTQYGPRRQEIGNWEAVDDDGEPIPVDAGTTAETSATSVNTSGDRIEYHDAIRDGMPWVMRVPPEHITIGPDPADFDSAQWIAHEFYRPVRDVRDDPTYNTRGWTPKSADLYDHPGRMGEDAARFTGSLRRDAGDEDERRLEDGFVKLYEIRDKRTETVKVMAEGHARWLLDEDDMLQIDGLPYEQVVWNENPNKAWGISDVDQMWSQQRELNERRAQIRDMISRCLPVIFVSQDLDPDEEKKLNQDLPYRIVRTNGQPGQVAYQFAPSVPQEMYQWDNALMKDIRMLSGQSRNELGEFAGSRTTASEAMVVHEQAQLRINERREYMAEVYTRIMRKVAQILFDNWKAERVEEVVGADGARDWIRFKMDDLRGEYNYRVNPDSQIATTGGLRRKEALEVFLQVIMPLAEAQNESGQRLINLEEAARQVINQYPNLDGERVINSSAPRPDQAMSLAQYRQRLAQGAGAPPQAAAGPQAQGPGPGQDKATAALQALQRAGTAPEGAGGEM